MLLKGDIRGNPKQAAEYLLTKADNEIIQILEVDGRMDADKEYFKETVMSMGLTAELTKSTSGLFHGCIMPAYGEDERIDWFEAADIMAKELNLENQRRVIVLHRKKEKWHAHVLWERYNHDTGKIVRNNYSRLAQTRARVKMENAFSCKALPLRNKRRPELKKTMTGLWNETTTGAEFLAAVNDKNYMIAAGVGRHPFMIVDETGRTFPLPACVEGARLKDIRQRLRHESLLPEKIAIEEMRQRKAAGNTGTGKQESAAVNTPKVDTSKKRAEQKAAFAQGASDITANHAKQRETLTKQFIETAEEITEKPYTTGDLAKEFADNRNEAVYGKTEKELLKEKLFEEQQRIEERKKKRKGKHMSIAIAFMLRLVMGNAEFSQPQKSIPSIRYLWDKTAFEVAAPMPKAVIKSTPYVIG